MVKEMGLKGSKLKYQWPEYRKDEEITPKEVVGEPSAERVRRLRDEELLASKLTMDIEYPYYFTMKWQERALRGLPLILRMALATRHAFSNVTPVIRPSELLVGQQTRFARGSHIHPNTAGSYIRQVVSKDLKRVDTAAAFDEITLMGQGGGNVTENIGNVISVSGVFGLRREYLPMLVELCEYWQGDTLEDSSEELKKLIFGEEHETEMAMYNTVFCQVGVFFTSPTGRNILDYQTVVEMGLRGMIDLCKKKISEQAIDKLDRREVEKRIFWRAEIEALEGMVAWIKNYAKEARRLAGIESDAVQKQEYEEIAEIMERISENPPRTFREALQLMWLCHTAVQAESHTSGISPGRWGQILYPYYRRDIDEGRLTRGQALELLECMRIKFSEAPGCSSPGISGIRSGSTFNNMCVGGVKADGSSAENDMEELILESGITMASPQPTLSLIYDSKLSQRFMLKAIECVKAGNGYPVFANNRIGMEFLMSTNPGMTLEDARAWSLGGCLEIMPSGTCSSQITPTFLNVYRALEMALFDGVEPRTGIRIFPATGRQFKTYQELWEATKAYYQKIWQIFCVGLNIDWILRRPLPVLSAFTKDCLERGLDTDHGGERYNAAWDTNVVGGVNLVNSLASIKKNVFEDKAFTLEELKDALVNNFGYRSGFQTGQFSMLEQEKVSDKWDRIHTLCLEAPKYGNDDPYVDSIFKEWMDYIVEVARSITSFLGHRYESCPLAPGTHGPLGQGTIASPDGRLAGISLADGSTSAFPGTDLNGPYALLNSVSCFDHSKHRLTQLNMKIHPSAISGIQGSRKLLQLIKSVMDRGIFHIQFNIVDSRMLKDAQLHPEQYRNLMVRVAGFTVYWVELPKPIQDEIIARTEYEEA